MEVTKYTTYSTFINNFPNIELNIKGNEFKFQNSSEEEIEIQTEYPEILPGKIYYMETRKPYEIYNPFEEGYWNNVIDYSNSQGIIITNRVYSSVYKFHQISDFEKIDDLNIKYKENDREIIRNGSIILIEILYHNSSYVFISCEYNIIWREYSLSENEK